ADPEADAHVGTGAEAEEAAAGDELTGADPEAGARVLDPEERAVERSRPAVGEREALAAAAAGGADDDIVGGVARDGDVGAGLDRFLGELGARDRLVGDLGGG